MHFYYFKMANPFIICRAQQVPTSAVDEIGWRLHRIKEKVISYQDLIPSVQYFYGLSQSEVPSPYMIIVNKIGYRFRFILVFRLLHKVIYWQCVARGFHKEK